MVERLLYRQIHPSFVKDGIVTSQAFKPIKARRLSVSDGNIVEPRLAWTRHTMSGLKSVGVMAVTEAECESQDLRVLSDPTQYKEHMVIDFGDLPKRDIRKAAKSLADDAKERGWCYRPTVDGQSERLN